MRRMVWPACSRVHFSVHGLYCCERGVLGTHDGECRAGADALLAQCRSWTEQALDTMCCTAVCHSERSSSVQRSNSTKCLARTQAQPAAIADQPLWTIQVVWKHSRVWQLRLSGGRLWIIVARASSPRSHHDNEKPRTGTTIAAASSLTPSTPCMSSTQQAVSPLRLSVCCCRSSHLSPAPITARRSSSCPRVAPSTPPAVAPESSTLLHHRADRHPLLCLQAMTRCRTLQ